MFFGTVVVAMFDVINVEVNTSKCVVASNSDGRKLNGARRFPSTNLSNVSLA